MNKRQFLEKKDRILNKGKAILLGTSWKLGVLYKIALYLLLVIFGFVFIYPLIHMLSYAFMTPADVTDPFVHFIPSKFFYTGNFSMAFTVLDFWKAFLRTLLVAVVPSVLQCLSTSLIGYGLARFRVPCKPLIIALVLATFIIPPQVTMIPQMLMYTNLGMDNILAFLVPALFGQGLKSAIFILIFFQFFRALPISLEEAAKIDGAGVFRIFFFIAMPLAWGGYILTFLFSFVWYFNETTLTAMFLGNKFQTLPLALESFLQSFNEIVGGGGSSSGETGKNINEAIYMAGTFLSVLPLLIVYFLTQKQFVESVDKAGITGE